MGDTDRRKWKAIAIAVGGLGLVLTLVHQADIVFESGIWYPVFHAGMPAVAATAAFGHERPTAGPLRLLAVGSWLLFGPVFALAVAVVLTLGFPPDVVRSPVVAVASAAFLYLGVLLVPVGLDVAAARLRGILTVLSLFVSPLGQALVAAAVIRSR
jgi:hypothetical protein